MIQRADILIEQNRYEEANSILIELLAKEPNNVYLLARTGELAIELNDLDRALSLINQAIAQDPEMNFLFYIKARVFIKKKNYNEAEECLDQAIQLNPEDPDYYAMWSSIKLNRKQFQAAYDLANQALELDGEHIHALNMRSTALLKMDRKEESFRTIQDALQEDPNNAYTHANMGWNLLEQKEPEQALKHFQEALKIDPNYDFAQAGMMEALKARYMIYRWFLQYSFWMGRMTSKYQWGVIIGFYLVMKGLRMVADYVEQAAPYLLPLSIALSFVAFSTWIITPVSNLFLRLNTFGKHLLDEKEKMSSNFVGGSAVIFSLAVISYYATNDMLWLPVAAYGFAMMVPYSLMFRESKFKHAFLIYAVTMAILGVAAIGVTFLTGELMNLLGIIFLFGIVGFQWIANFLMIREDG